MYTSTEPFLDNKTHGSKAAGLWVSWLSCCGLLPPIHQHARLYRHRPEHVSDFFQRDALSRMSSSHFSAAAFSSAVRPRSIHSFSSRSYRVVDDWYAPAKISWRLATSRRKFPFNFFPRASKYAAISRSSSASFMHTATSGIVFIPAPSSITGLMYVL